MQVKHKPCDCSVNDQVSSRDLWGHKWSGFPAEALNVTCYYQETTNGVRSVTCAWRHESKVQPNSSLIFTRWAHLKQHLLTCRAAADVPLLCLSSSVGRMSSRVGASSTRLLSSGWRSERRTTTPGGTSGLSLKLWISSQQVQISTSREDPEVSSAKDRCCCFNMCRLFLCSRSFKIFTKQEFSDKSTKCFRF